MTSFNSGCVIAKENPAAPKRIQQYDGRLLCPRSHQESFSQYTNFEEVLHRTYTTDTFIYLYEIHMHSHGCANVHPSSNLQWAYSYQSSSASLSKALLALNYVAPIAIVQQSAVGRWCKAHAALAGSTPATASAAGLVPLLHADKASFCIFVAAIVVAIYIYIWYGIYL